MFGGQNVRQLARFSALLSAEILSDKVYYVRQAASSAIKMMVIFSVISVDIGSVLTVIQFNRLNFLRCILLED